MNFLFWMCKQDLEGTQKWLDKIKNLEGMFIKRHPLAYIPYPSIENGHPSIHRISLV